MGLFDKIKGSNDKKDINILVPITGKIINLSDVPDPVFAEKMMGDGFAFEPKEGKVFSPIKGEVVSLFPTNHAIGLKLANNVEILIHVGLDTVNLQGEGFNTKVKIGDKVEEGQLLIEFDIELIKEKCPSTVTPFIFTNLEDFTFEVEYKDVVAKEENIIKLS